MVNNLQSIIEALLFSSDRSLSSKDLQVFVPETEISEIEEAVGQIQKKFEDASHGIYLEHVANGYQFRTKIDKAPWIKKLLQERPHRLTRAQLETLAILAYKQPVTKVEVDAIRGVDSFHLIKILLDKKLIRIVGVKEAPGRPLIYGTTTEFLEFFNLSSLNALPSLKEIQELKEKISTETPLFAKDSLDISDLEKLKEENSQLPLNQLKDDESVI